MAENRNAQQVREITDKLEQGLKELFESERFKEYLKTMSKFYNYSFNNTLLIAMQKPDATLIAGYTAWQRNFDRHVMKGEKGIKIFAPAPYKVKEEHEKLDPVTQKPILDKDGKPVTETVEVTRPAFKVVSVFDVSQTDGKELPDIAVDELTGSVENYAAFFDALKELSPVPIAFENITDGAKGYFSHVENRIAIQEGMSEIQTIKTAIHEIAHAKLHAVTPGEKVAPEDKKDRRTKEVEAESVAYVLAQTIQQKDHDGRISRDCKEWAKGMDASPDHATQLIIDSVNPGLVSLFTEEFVRQTAISRTQEQAPAEQSKPAVPEEGPETPAPKEPEQAAPVKHRLTPEEKKIKEAVMDTLKAQIAGRNDGMLSTYRSSNQSFKVMVEYKVRIEGNTVTRDGEPMFAIHRRHSAKKVQGCYRELTPTLEYIGKEKTQEAAREKPSIREQLRAAAKNQPERKTPVKQKSHDVGLE